MTKVLFFRKGRRTDPLPPSIDASPYRARPSGAALPLCEGENKAAHFAGVFCPSQRGRRERSERGGQFGNFFVQSPAPPYVQPGRTVKVSPHVWVIPDGRVDLVP